MHWTPPGMPPSLYDEYQWKPGRTGLYESNYLKANAPDGRQALWLKHNILAWKDPQKPAIVELWCIFFEKGQPPRAFKQELPASRVRVKSGELGLEGDGILLSPARTATAIRDGDHAVSWDIAMSPWSGPVSRPLIHFPHAEFYRWGFPKKKMLTPEPKTLWNGRLSLDGRDIAIRDWVGFRNHNWGTEHAFRYAYGNCNLFDGAPDVVVDGFSAKIRLGPVVTPYLSMAVQRQGSVDTPFNGFLDAFRGEAIVDFPHWELHLSRAGTFHGHGARGNTQRLHWTMRGQPDQFIGLPYHQPSGSLSYCYNTKWAHTTLYIEEQGVEPRFYTSDQGELEFLVSEPLAGIPLYSGHAPCSSHQ